MTPAVQAGRGVGWRQAVGGLRHWPGRRRRTAAVAALVTVVVVAVPTDLIPNPVFGREVPPTWWSWPVLAVTAVLAGLLTATYVRADVAGAQDGIELDRPSRLGAAGGFLGYLAVGCPVCNKIALLALGYTGALRWFAPVQPFLAGSGVLLLAYALVRRLQGELACAVPPRP